MVTTRHGPKAKSALPMFSIYSITNFHVKLRRVGACSDFDRYAFGAAIRLHPLSGTVGVVMQRFGW